jgi:hypothetical protein
MVHEPNDEEPSCIKTREKKKEYSTCCEKSKVHNGYKVLLQQSPKSYEFFEELSKQDQILLEGSIVIGCLGPIVLLPWDSNDSDIQNNFWIDSWPPHIDFILRKYLKNDYATLASHLEKKPNKKHFQKELLVSSLLPEYIGEETLFLKKSNTRTSNCPSYYPSCGHDSKKLWIKNEPFISSTSSSFTKSHFYCTTTNDFHNSLDFKKMYKIPNGNQKLKCHSKWENHNQKIMNTSLSSSLTFVNPEQITFLSLTKCPNTEATNNTLTSQQLLSSSDVLETCQIPPQQMFLDEETYQLHSKSPETEHRKPYDQCDVRNWYLRKYDENIVSSRSLWRIESRFNEGVSKENWHFHNHPSIVCRTKSISLSKLFGQKNFNQIFQELSSDNFLNGWSLRDGRYTDLDGYIGLSRKQQKKFFTWKRITNLESAKLVPPCIIRHKVDSR